MKLLRPQFSEILLFLYLITSKNFNLQEQGKYNQKRLLQEGHMRHKHGTYCSIGNICSIKSIFLRMVKYKNCPLAEADDVEGNLAMVKRIFCHYQNSVISWKDCNSFRLGNYLLYERKFHIYGKPSMIHFIHPYICILSKKIATTQLPINS